MGAIFGYNGPPDEALANRIGAVLLHRGTLALHVEAGPSATLGLRSFWDDRTRQARGEGSFREGNRAVVLAGHLTNLPEVFDEARIPPDRPAAEALLRLFERNGPEFVRSLRGPFAMAVAEGPTLHLSRDGAGARSLYHGRHAGRAFFASEPKGVLAAPGFPRRLRPAAVAEYLTFSFIPGPGTMLADLSEVPAGHIVTIKRDGEPASRRYFDFEAEEDAELDDLPESVWIRRFRDGLAASVAEQLPSGGEPVAVFLSGGIDSSVVAAEVARQHSGPVRTFAIHFGEQYPNELAFARMVADRIGTAHEEVLIQPRDFLPRLRRMIWHLDEPIGDPITQPNYELSALVSRECRWAFNGEGGDPCFGGPKNLPMLLQHWYGGLDRPENFRERAYLASYRRGFEEIARLLSPELLAEIDVERDLEAPLAPFFQADRPRLFLHKMLAINIRLKGAHLILPKVERMTGAWGLTPIAPLFDERLIRLSFRMPARLKLDQGIEKQILKRAFAGELPEPVLSRPKSGMRVPVHEWFRGELGRHARSILSPRSLRRSGIFRPDRVRQLLRYEIEEGPGRYGLRLWMLSTFEIWRRIVIEGEAA